MKKASEYEEEFDLIETNGESLMYVLDVRKAIQQAQKDAIEASLKLAAEIAIVEVIDHEEILATSVPPNDGKHLILPIYGVDEDSILNLKQELFKEIEDE